MSEAGQPTASLPADDPNRTLVIAHPLTDEGLPHIGLAGDTYTVTVNGADTAGRFCVVDMHVPPGGGPGPHRHDFEETFIVLEGEVQITFRGQQSTASAGATVHVPANAPHQFHNASSQAARLLCICSPAGQEEFFQLVGVPVATRTTPPPPLDKNGMEAFLKKAQELAPRFKTELLKQA